MTFIKALREDARNQASGFTFNPTNDPQTINHFTEEKLNSLVTTIALKTLEEVERCLNEYDWTVRPGQDSIAISDIFTRFKTELKDDI